MEIKTKFNIGESMWSIHDGRAKGIEINAVIIERNRDGKTAVSYRDRNFNLYPERQCFLSKEELLEYFMSGK